METYYTPLSNIQNYVWKSQKLTKLIVSLPSFIPQKINNDQIYQQFGFMSVIARDAVPSPSENQFIDEPLIITDIKTEFEVPNGLHSVSCLSDRDSWICREDNLIRLYNLEGNLVKAIKTKTVAEDITVTRNGELVYTDDIKKTLWIWWRTKGL